MNTIQEWLTHLDGKKKVYFLCAFVLVVVIYVHLHRAPADFPVGQVVTIEYGESLQDITNTLYERHIISSPFIFRTRIILFGGEKKVMAGDYLLDKKEGVASLAYRFLHGKFHLEVAKITIPEGWNVFEIRDYLGKTLINFDKVGFMKLAKAKEGYLFPDTYFVSPAATPEKVLDLLEKNFQQKITSVKGIASSTHSYKDIIIMASILEEEARTTESRKVIAGILWKRISLGMPLQVDSTFSYINGKNTYELTLDDLKIDSPYNTYVYKGLPPTPISNPGLDAIEAALHPTSSKYLYFLSSKSGKMYYATTFEQHKKNKELYLNK